MQHSKLLGLALPVFVLRVAPFPLDAASLIRRDLAGDVCGTPNGNTVASDDRNMDTWNSAKIDDWFYDKMRPYVVTDFKYPDIYAPRDASIQTVILKFMGSDGSEQCDEIIDPNCSGTGLDWNLCKSHPEAHFIWFAITHFAHFLNKLQSTLTISSTSVGLLTHDLVTKFFTPQADPERIIVPVSIINGITGAISSAWAPAGVAAGVGTIVNGILTQAGLDKPDPLEQWGQVQDAVGTAFTKLTTGLESYFKTTLKELPIQHNNPFPYYADPLGMMQILKGGLFAKTPPVGSFNPGIYGSIAASGINALWTADKVFLMKLTDDAYSGGAPDDKACDALKSYTICIEGVAYILLRWQTSVAKKISWGNPEELDPRSWRVRGAFKTESNADDDDHFPDYMLDKEDIVRSIVKTWDEHGFPFKDQNKATLDLLTSGDTALDQKDLVFFSLPVCDMGKIMGEGKHMDLGRNWENKGPIEVYGACTCVQDLKWPRDDYPLDHGLLDYECRKHWIST